jgi:hypothetical protein
MVWLLGVVDIVDQCLQIGRGRIEDMHVRTEVRRLATATAVDDELLPALHRRAVCDQGAAQVQVGGHELIVRHGANRDRAIRLRF